MSTEGRKFAEKWADENIKFQPEATAEQVSAVVQQLIVAATIAEVSTEEVAFGVGEPFKFVAARMGSPCPESKDA